MKDFITSHQSSSNTGHLVLVEVSAQNRLSFLFYFYFRVNSVVNTHNRMFQNDYVILYLKHTARTFSILVNVNVNQTRTHYNSPFMERSLFSSGWLSADIMKQLRHQRDLIGRKHVVYCTGETILTSLTITRCMVNAKRKQILLTA